MDAIVGLGAVSGWLSTAPHGADKGTGAHVIEVSDGAEQIGAASFQGERGAGTGLPF